MTSEKLNSIATILSTLSLLFFAFGFSRNVQKKMKAQDEIIKKLWERDALLYGELVRLMTRFNMQIGFGPKNKKEFEQ